MLPIETRNPMFGLYKYPKAKEFMEIQQDKTWTAQEIPVEKDLQDFLVNMDEHQQRLSRITTTTFVEIEQTVGDIWETLAKWFPHSEIEGACTEMSRMERSVHAFFYQKMSDVMNIDPAETAEIQETVVALKDKLQMLKQITKRLSDDKVLGLATIACIEQVLLFSNFAMLKSFKANGHNMMKNTLTGVDFVIRDEQIHGDFAAYLHNTYIEESKSFDFANHTEQVFKVLEEIISHEDAVIDFVFEGAESINDITPQQLKTFARSRANHLLENLGMPSKYEIESNAIADWFYQGVKSIKVHDFFAASTQQYKRTWKFDNFSLKNIKGVK